MNRQQVIQLIIFAIFIGASGISWLLRRLAEEAQKRAARQAAEQRRLEAMRTGRDEGAFEETPSATPGRDERRPMRPVEAPGSLAEKRRQQLEELRRRQLQRSQGQGTAARVQVPASKPRVADARRSSMPSSVPGSTGTTVPTRPSPRSTPPGPRSREPQRSLPQQPANAGDAARRDAIRRQQERARQAAEKARRQAAAAAAQAVDDQGESSTHRLIAGEASDSAYAVRQRAPQGMPGIARNPGAAVELIEGASIADLRRAIVLSEILSPPVSLREP
ncbi:MAG: hypothetical protein AMXMBFR58_23960 [Phycisphaerae bacterium]